MRTLGFFECRRTAITALLKGSTIESLIAQARTAEFDGADGIAVELCLLPPELRTEENFSRLMEEVRLPFMFLVYRNDEFLGADDEARQACLMAAAHAGAEIIDVMGDLFDPSPRELTRNPEAIRRQKELICRYHAAGAKVVISSHMSEALSAEEVLEHLREQASRGADLVKIVTKSDTEEDFLEAIRATMLLKRELEVPFIHLTSGKFGRLHRYLGTKLGCSIEFAVSGYSEKPLLSQPTIRSFRGVMESLCWRI